VKAFKLYGFTGSGNCEKVRMVVDFLSLPYEWVEVPIFDGAPQGGFSLSPFPAIQDWLARCEQKLAR